MSGWVITVLVFFGIAALFCYTSYRIQAKKNELELRKVQLAQQHEIDLIIAKKQIGSPTPTP